MRITALALLLVAGCDDIPQARTEAEIRRIAADQNGQLISDNLDMKVEIAKLKHKTETLQSEVDLLGRSHDSLVNTFNGNVKQDNEGKVRLMTARGACGYEPAPGPDGGTIYTPRECTMKDLR